MPNTLDAEEVEEILETYSETQNRRETAEITQHSKDTVRKYVDEAIENNDPRMPEVAPADVGVDDSDATAEQPGDSPFNRPGEQRVIDDYSGMSPGDFIKEFFEDFEVGVKGTWMAIQARRADRRQLLPTKDSLKKDMLSMKSGIAQNAIMEAEYIAEEYWAEAQHFLRQTGYEAEGTPYSGSMQGVGGAMANGGIQQQGFGNQFVGQDGGQPMSNPQAGIAGQMQAIQQQLNQMQNRLDSGQVGGGSGGGSSGTLSKLRELQEEKQILEELSGGDDRLDEIEQQIQSIQQQIISQESGGGVMPMGGEQSLEDRLLDLAARSEDVSFGQILEFIEQREGVSQDPQVMEMEMEKEIEMEKLEHRAERQEAIADTLGNLMDRIGEGIGRQLVNGGGDGVDGEADEQAADSGTEQAEAGGQSAQPTPQAQPAQGAMQPQAMQPQGPMDKECPHCGTMLEPSQGGLQCPECEYGVAQCDLCTVPVEVPPRGDAPYGKCATCEAWIEEADAVDGEVSCDECDWAGSVAELRGEGLLCDNCGNVRPIARQMSFDEMDDQLDEILEQ